MIGSMKGPVGIRETRLQLWSIGTLASHAASPHFQTLKMGVFYYGMASSHRYVLVATYRHNI